MVKQFETEYVSYEELYLAYLACRQNKRRKRNAIIFEMDSYVELYELYCELNSMTYEVGTSIVFCVDYPTKREVFAANFRDRIIHHLLINRLTSYFEKEFIDDNYSCRIGKGTEYGIQRCYDKIKECSENYAKDCWILKGDLKSFFATINKDILYSLLCDFILEKLYDNEETQNYRFTIWLLGKIIFNVPQKNCIRCQDLSHWENLPFDKSLFNLDDNIGLPIGNLTSQLFASFLLNGFDHWVIEKLGFKYYGRYVDDFYIIDTDKERLTEAIPLIKEYLKTTVSVTLHPNKVYIQHYTKGVKFIGSVIKPNRIYVGNRLKGNAWNVFKEISEDIKKGYTSKVDILHYRCRLNSYLGFMRHRSSYNIRKKLFSSEYYKSIKNYLIPCDHYSMVVIKSD